MRIERVKNIAQALECLPFEREIRNKHRDSTRESHLLLFIESQLPNPLFGFWMAYDDNENLKGYVVAIIGLFPGHERLHLLRIYAKDKSLFQQFEDILKEWAKQYRVKIAVMTARTAKEVKIYQRRYHYVPVSINMERRYL